MIPQIDYDTLKFELEQRIQQSELSRQAQVSRVAEVRRLMRLRWALGSALLQLGVAILGDDALRTDHVDGRSSVCSSHSMAKRGQAAG